MAFVAVTPILGESLTQLSAGLIAMPDYVHASVSETAGIRDVASRGDRARPRQAEARIAAPRSAEDRVAARLAGAFDDSVRKDWSRVAPASSPRFADLDTRRFWAQPSTVRTPPAFAQYAWNSANGGDGAEGRLAQRLALVAWPATSGADALTLAMVSPAPEADVSVDGTEQADIASLEDRLPDTIAVPTPRPRRPSNTPQGGRTQLAYAPPDAAAEKPSSDGIFGRLFGGGNNRSGLPGPGSKVAVYDITSATVYMPNGEKLEAHSGLAHMKDDPRYVTEKMRGPTPPNVYNLRMRESRFHGVEAIRLLPADGKKKFNRDGLLAHTYMYVGGGGKDRSQSNGCVVFKDYSRFLTAFKRGDIDRLIVVRSMKELPTYMAAL